VAPGADGRFLVGVAYADLESIVVTHTHRTPEPPVH
jgi:hypothetical protein